ncbi:Homoserine/homoserine lactone efflux protein [Achromobacter anxifer]|uniref:Homoserine/homoserine lactone efflux protein n=3 Tax=Achromobacter TaxID=222 RepID=A0A6S7E7B4_9BURK|nr:Homoserine/homoserine lactone efflux protein [Achromobacter anxifer]CAB5517174.1 Homoserine/homoserine lactone efflux protein [Achromobacter anxifer]
MADMAMFLGALLIVYVVPGPDMILLLETGVLRGRGQALAVAVGLAIARAAHVTLAALGLAALFKTHPWAFEVARTVGGCYLVWLGVKLWRAGPVAYDAGGQVGPRQVEPRQAELRQAELRQTGPQQAARSRAGLGPAFLSGVLTNVLNPKALLFCSVLLPQFVSPAHGPIGQQFAVLGVILVSLGLALDALCALAGGAVGRWMSASPRAQKIQSRVFGLALIGFGLRLTFAQRPA